MFHIVFFLTLIIGLHNANAVAPTCPAGYRLEPVATCDWVQVPCTIANGSGLLQEDQSCKLATCDTAFHPVANTCVPNKSACDIANGTGEVIWPDTACVAKACNQGFHIEGLACAKDVVVATTPVYPGCAAAPTTFDRTLTITPSTFKASALTPGSRVIMGAGSYPAIVLNKTTAPQLVAGSKWVSLEFAPGARVAKIDIDGVQKVQVLGAEIRGNSGPLFDVGVGSKDIIIAKSVIQSLNEDPNKMTEAQWGSAPDGIRTVEASCIAIVNNKIKMTRVGMLTRTKYTELLPPKNAINVLIQDNEINGWNRDGLEALGTNITVKNNKFLDAYTSVAQQKVYHSDGIQLYTFLQDTTQRFDNIQILDNYIALATSQDRQFVDNAAHGIGFFDGYLTNLVIKGNQVLALTYHGIAVRGAVGCLIENNTVVNTRQPLANGTRYSWIDVGMTKGDKAPSRPTQNCKVRNNVAGFYNQLAGNGNTYSNNYTYDRKKLPTDIFTEFKVTTPTKFDLRPKPGGAIFGKGQGAL